MKNFQRIFSVLLLVIATIGGIALPQTVNAQSGVVMTATKNTHTNADTSYHTLALVGNYNALSVQVNGVKTSGTPGGTVVLQGSDDGTNYVTIKVFPEGAFIDSTSYATGYGTYTIANTTGTQSVIFLMDKAFYGYYRVKVITSGTQVSSWSARLLSRRN